MALSSQQGFLTTGRANQKQRTRRALLDAAMRLVEEGRSPTVPEVAEEAMVSTATAYRYFPNARVLMFEVATRQSGPELFDLITDLPDAPEERVDHLVSVVADLQLASESLWRAVLGANLERWFGQSEADDEDRVPVRGSHRLEAVEVALEPLRESLPPADYRRLMMATMLVFGVEAMVAARDAASLDPAETKEVMRWAARALQRQALLEATGADTADR